MDKSRGRRRQLAIGVAAIAIVTVGAVLVFVARGRVTRVAPVVAPRNVTVVEARAARYRPFRRYLGTIEPWIEAKIGPQLVSAYVETVLVRPGAVVKAGQVMATLDCRSSSAASRAVAMHSRSIRIEQEALAHEAARVAELREGGFASLNEIEHRAADSASKKARLMESRAKLQGAMLEVNDCVLRAPFAGEVASRQVDPGAFVHPGAVVAVLVDRRTVRVTADVPEADFDIAAPGAAVEIRSVATKREVHASLTRRSPAADLSTRTIHVEADVPDPDRAFPVGTTAELDVDTGNLIDATEIPRAAATVRDDKATVFLVANGVVRKAVYNIIGERSGGLFVDPRLFPGSHVVAEGGALLKDGDHVEETFEGYRSGGEVGRKLTIGALP